MKAIRKFDGKEVDVRIYSDLRYTDIENDESGYMNIYNPEALILEEPTDWGEFRRQTVKDLVCILLGRNDPVKLKDGKRIETFDDVVDYAVGAADLIIEKLKEPNKEG